MRDSGLVRVFRSGGKDAVVDPATREAVGEAFIADCDLPRRDRNGVLRFLEQKYGVKDLDTMDLGTMAGTVRAPVRTSPAQANTSVATGTPSDSICRRTVATMSGLPHA
jgi:hypothetical protein